MAGHCVWSPKFQLRIVRISEYVPLRQTCFETLPLMVNDIVRLLSLPFSLQVCEDERDWGEKRVRICECLDNRVVLCWGTSYVTVLLCVLSSPGTCGLWREWHL